MLDDIPHSYIECEVMTEGSKVFYKTIFSANAKKKNHCWNGLKGVAILLAVLIVVVVTGVNDWQKDRQFRGLQDKIEGDKEVVVLHDSKLQ
ncbi:hypothetical protein GJ496_008362 [Pomphorhynchus laevis]|nr:hypothetical protein GJ496_008362 [Pomphorhynchus laevis]